MKLNLVDNLEKMRPGDLGARFASPISTASAWKDGITGLGPVLDDEVRVPPGRWLAMLLLVLVGGLVIVGRLFQLQVVKGREYFVRAEQNHMYIRHLPAERGVIYDRQGVVIARNVPAFSVGLVYAEIADGQVDAVTSNLQEIFSLSPEEVEDKLGLARMQPTVQTIVAQNITHDQQIAFETRQSPLAGISIVEDTTRSYPRAELVAAVLGYTGEINADELDELGRDRYRPGSMIGRTGIEKQYESRLTGKLGRAVVETEANGKIRSETILSETVPGENVNLTIDLVVQEKARELLRQGIDEYQAWAGSVMVVDVNGGEVLAMVSEPTYDNNIFSQGDDDRIRQTLADERSLLVNRVISGLYSPGSTVKPAIGGYALEKGLISANTRIAGTPQVIEIGGWKFPDWTYTWGRGPHGNMTLADAIAVSSDTFFYKIGGGFPPGCANSNQQTAISSEECRVDGMGVEGLVMALQAFGFGQKTGIDLPDEVTGLVPDPAWKEQVRGEPWFLGNSYHLSIGQGDLIATPIQVLHEINIVATDHKTPRMHLLLEPGRFGLDQVGQDKPVALENLRVAREGMVKSVSEGIVYPLRGSKVKVAAKTGTAEFGHLNAKGEYETHAWVAGFAPVEDPQISFVIMLEAGGQSSNAAEVARKFIDWYFGER